MVSTYFLFIATIEAFKKEIDLKLTATETLQKNSMVYKKFCKYRARAGFKLNTSRLTTCLENRAAKFQCCLTFFLDFVYL